MTTEQARQINAHLILTSAFYFIAHKDMQAGIILMDARLVLGVEMEPETLLIAITLSDELDFLGRAA